MALQHYCRTMTLRIVGAGLPRTGTTSLKHAIERLTGGNCYHMTEVFPRFDTHLPLWQRAIDGDLEVFDEIFDGFTATLDWPSSAFWPLLMERYPDSLVVLSRRKDAETWWASVDRTVWEGMRRETDMPEWDRMVAGLTERFGVRDLDDPAEAMAAYAAQNQAARDAVPADRFLEWEPADGWKPLCDALGVAVPDEAFPHRNVTAEFRAVNGWD